MSGDGVDDIRIPMVFLFMEEAQKLLEVLFIFPPAALTQYLFFDIIRLRLREEYIRPKFQPQVAVNCQQHSNCIFICLFSLQFRYYYANSINNNKHFKRDKID